MDADAFDAFYAGSFSRVVGQLYAMCGDFSEAQDCTQEAFVRAWDRRAQLDGAESPEAWVRTTAWRLCVSRWRRARLALRPPDRARSAPPPAEPDVTHTALVKALRQIREESPNGKWFSLWDVETEPEQGDLRSAWITRTGGQRVLGVMLGVSIYHVVQHGNAVLLVYSYGEVNPHTPGAVERFQSELAAQTDQVVDELCVFAADGCN